MSSSSIPSSSPGPEWIAAVGAKPACITLSSPWENGFIESFTRACAMSCSTAIFYSLKQARIVIESWRCHCNTVRRHWSLGYKPPAPEAFVPAFAARATTQSQQSPPPALVPRPTMR
jgi:transposase InsO family protein